MGLVQSQRATPPGDPNFYIGSLVHNKRDLTGNLYMRNRYYDAQAGRFSQEDPIGLAGGLNAYGFAAGDPVSYNDPYGLCPESMRMPDGRCPGGLSSDQWNSVEEATATLDNHESTQVMERLLAGGYSAADIGLNAVAHAPPNFDGTHSVVLNTRPGVSFFEFSAGDRGWVLSHEHGHGLQNEGTVEDRGTLWARMNLQRYPEVVGAIGRAFQAGLERDADRHACAHSNPGIAFRHRCRP